ncbi:SCAN domain-containing protein 3-like [Octopus sinensis]|uniref:SCAN domain-containing protein 3-like n=1 Tax=Octopus sinensis TaxID=2607531 RepID=A0A6P7TBU1_9MOLL|nr:SCAN domain-containing protein 3-like [Octopus sinensis]
MKAYIKYPEETNTSKRQFYQFPEPDSLKDELMDEDLTTYRNYLQSLHDNMVERFQDVIAQNIPNWYRNPFEVDTVDCVDDVQEELIELQNDNDATVRYRHIGKEGLWCHQSILNSYHNPWKHLKLLLLAFPASYLVESGFSHVETLFSYKSIGLDMIQREDLRLKLASLKANVSALAASHQIHSSH